MIEELYKDYEKYASFYDIFNKDRNYEREIRFILNILKNKKRVLDLGCGTGLHLSVLENVGYITEGIDINENMILLSKKKVKGNIYQENILNYKIDEIYDAIFSINSVFNHLKSYDEFEMAFSNSLDHLDKNGIMIIDLDNKGCDCDIYDKVDGNERYIECLYHEDTRMKIITYHFTIGLKTFIFEHEYFIYDIDMLKQIMDKYNVTYAVLTNYSKLRARNNSERIQIVIKKN